MKAILVSVAALMALALPPAVEASAAVRIRTFDNCTAMHRVYPHGVGRWHAHDHTSGTPVTNFFRHNRLYEANAGSDRDGDKIACEA